MKILADTHAFLWFITDAPQLSKKAKTLLEAQDTERLLSVASVWEMAIKSRLGKLALRQPLDEFLPAQITANRFGLLDITAGTRFASRNFHFTTAIPSTACSWHNASLKT